SELQRGHRAEREKADAGEAAARRSATPARERRGGAAREERRPDRQVPGPPKELEVAPAREAPTLGPLGLAGVLREVPEKRGPHSGALPARATEDREGSVGLREIDARERGVAQAVELVAEGRVAERSPFVVRRRAG